LPLGIQDEPPVPGACALVEKAAFASAVPWRGVGGGGDGYRDSRPAVGMIHELLLALSGYPGSIFTWNKRSGLQEISALGEFGRRFSCNQECMRRKG